MTEQRVIVIGINPYAGLLGIRLPDDTPIIVKDYEQGGRAIDGMNLDLPPVIEELTENGVVLERDIEVGHMGDGTLILGTEAYIPYLLTPYGLFRPGRPPSEMSPEEIEAATKRYAEGIAAI